jgi:CRP-like cAMP-binding protein
MSVSDLRKLEEVLLGDPDLEQHLVNFEPGQLILRSGESNDNVFLILQGQGDLEILEAETDMSVLKVGSFGRGDFLGLASFWNQEPNVADARAVDDVQCLVLDRDQFLQLSQEYPEFNQAIQNVFISNLSHRYRRGITLNRQIATLSRRLEKEGKDLKKAIS